MEAKGRIVCLSRVRRKKRIEEIVQLLINKKREVYREAKDLLDGIKTFLVVSGALFWLLIISILIAKILENK